MVVGLILERYGREKNARVRPWSFVTIPESFLVDGLNQFAMSHQRKSSSSFDASLFHPDDAPHLGAEELLQQQQHLVSNVSLTDLSGIEGGEGGRGVGPADGFISATSDGVPNSELKQPPFFSTPYTK